MFNVLISDKLGDDGVAVLADADDVTVDVRTGLSEAELIEVIGDYDALIIRSGTQVTAPILEAGKRLRVEGWLPILKILSAGQSFFMKKRRWMSPILRIC